MNKADAVEVDQTILKEVDAVNWSTVSEADAASFGLAVGFFRDSNRVCQLRRTAWGTAVGGVVSSSVLAILALALGAGPWFALNLVMVHQTIRAAVLWWRSRQALKQRAAIEQQALEVAKDLAQRYPAQDAEAA